MCVIRRNHQLVRVNGEQSGLKWQISIKRIDELNHTPLEIDKN